MDPGKEASPGAASAAPKFPDMSLDAPRLASVQDRNGRGCRAGQGGD